jgi:FkbM family methyltransferase
MKFEIEDVVRAMYIAGLGREPEDEGLRAYKARLHEEGHSALPAIARSFYESDERELNAIRDHSQFGEFRILLKMLLASAIGDGYIVDVGARGRDRSNSYDLLRLFGWRGLLIEANPNLWRSIEQEFSGLDFKLVKCAVSDTDGIAPFFIGTNDDVSSLLEGAASDWGEIRGQVDVDVRRLASILSQSDVPLNFNVLSLDIEGLDIRVFNDLIDNSGYRPAHVIIEASYDFATSSLNDLPFSASVRTIYEIAEKTRANLILARKDR